MHADCVPALGFTRAFVREGVFRCYFFGIGVRGGGGEGGEGGAAEEEEEGGEGGDVHGF